MLNVTESGENYFILGLSDRARTLNFFQVPTRFVWHLLDSVFGEIYFILGLSGRARILSWFQVPRSALCNYWTRCSVRFILYLWGASLARHIYTFLVPLVLLGVYCAQCLLKIILRPLTGTHIELVSGAIHVFLAVAGLRVQWNLIFYSFWFGYQ